MQRVLSAIMVHRIIIKHKKEIIRFDHQQAFISIVPKDPHSRFGLVLLETIKNTVSFIDEIGNVGPNIKIICDTFMLLKPTRSPRMTVTPDIRKH